MIDLICFMILDGQVIDLSYLCQGSPAPVVAPAVPKKRVDIEELSFSNGRFSGRLRNLSDSTILFPKIHFESYADGKFLESGSFYADLQSIPPGGSSGFQWFTRNGADLVEVVNVSWQ